MPAKSLLFAALETAINRYLQLDPFSSERLQRLDDKVVALEISDFAFNLFFVFNGNRVDLLGEYAGVPDCRLSGKSRDLFNLKQQSGGLFQGQITLSGDLNLVQAFKDVFEHMDIDWEAHLARVVGDLLAHQIVKRVSKFWRWGQDSLASAKVDLMDYVQEEKRLLPAQAQYQQYLESVQALHQKANQLQIRVQRLATKLT